MRRVFYNVNGFITSKWVSDDTDRDHDGIIENNVPEMGQRRSDPEMSDGVVTGEHPEIGVPEAGNYEPYQN